MTIPYKSYTHRIFLFLLALAMLASCSDHRDILGPHVNADFKKRFKDGMPPSLDSIFTKTNITNEEKEALSFLYAYMPLADVMNYDAKFHLTNVRSALRAVKEMPWGKNLPDKELRYFVLPARVNNEDLDLSRPIFYAELKDRVKNLTMEEAILEVNHWCHEKVTYQETDSRTNSPLATMRAAIGSSGEESTFVVAALRSVGIPARQVFVSRWAHVNGRHAWVEAWANGRWHFIGACEPAPVLDFGWFNQSASRGMMIKTRVFGYYKGVEEVLDTSAMFTAINVTANYAPTTRQKVRVVDLDGNPVEGAEVRFSIYNNAEFYAFNDLITDEDGIASVQTGIGDMIAWTRKGDKFQFGKVKTGELCELTLALDGKSETVRNFDIVPPLAYTSRPVLSEKMIEENNRRLEQEDSIRAAYVSTFYDLRKSTSLAIKINAYPSKIAKIMANARGNWRVIEEFLLKHKDNSDKAVDLLETISDKDLNDITMDALEDHFSTPFADTELYKEYILNPRIANERISPYKHALSTALKKICPTPKALVKWVLDSIGTDSLYNMEQLPTQPVGVLKLKKAGWHSRDIFFVAAARSLGFPARIDPVTGNIQYHDSTEWVNVKFSRDIRILNPKGKFRLVPKAENTVSNPEYYTYFTISRIENNIPRVLGYPSTFTVDSFANGVDVESGQYLLVTGERLLKGGVKAQATLFHVRPGETTDVPFMIRLDPLGIKAFGSFDSNNSFMPLNSKVNVTISSKVGSGCYIVGFIDPREDASIRALNDISAVRDQLEQLGYKILLLMPEDAAETFDPAQYPSLPSNVILGQDPNGNIYNFEIELNLSPDSPSMPTFVLADTFNRALWINRGHKPGLGKEIVKVLSSLNK